MPTPQSTEDSPALAGDANADKANILVVDDRPENLLVFKSTLDELGQQVVTARSGEEALKRLLEEDFAVILLDVNMPGMDGLELATFIRGRHKTARTPIIFLTAYAEEMRTAKGYALGAVDYIMTPVMPDILRTKVRVFVELYLMTRQAQRQADQRIAFAREQAARAAAEESIRRSTFLAEAGDILTHSLDVTTTVKALAQFVVPFLGDMSAITLVDEQGHASRTELAWRRPADGDGRNESVARLDSPALSQAMRDALETGSLKVVADLNPADTALTATQFGEAGPKTFELGFALRSLAVLPLVARGRRLGTLVLGLSQRQPDAATLALMKDLATRAAVSLDNCLLYARIQEADQRKNEFLAMLAHELRNPLAPVRNAVQVLRLSSSDKARLDWATDVIDRQTQQLTRLVDDLIDVARITRGKIALKIEPVDVAAVVAFAVEMNRQLVDAREHQLVVTVPESPLFVRGDYARVAQVLSNLMNNAVKFTEPGGRISVSAEADGAEVVFRVRDSGIGIPKDMLASIFGLFTQGDRSLDRSQGGLGIGLTIVHRLVSMQGGSVQAYSDGPRTGAEFVVRLPRVTEISTKRSQPEAPSHRGVAHRMLIVDDYADAAESMAALLELEGQQVKIANNGLAGIDLARSFQPRIVFLDIGLPGMNGYEVARALRAMPETKNALLVAVSGYGQPEDQQRSKEAGFDLHLVKPVDLLALRGVIDSQSK